MNLKLAVTEMDSRVLWELVSDFAESAEHTLGATDLIDMKMRKQCWEPLI
jgi:hypothetical protein